MKPSYAKMPPVPLDKREWPSRNIEHAPAWCAVDLRDGNQALPNPMTPEQKRQYFQLLVDIGFKEIEIGFPAASADDFNFCRVLIEENLIPDDVTISILTQARPALIARSMEALAGVSRAVVHFYVATSDLHRKFVFNLERDQLLKMAVDSTRQIREAARACSTESQIGLEFSPEEFTDTDPDFAIEICDAVGDAWELQPGEKIIYNLPQTVERRLPNQYADMLENFIRRQKHPEQHIVSIHCHNDMGMAVAASMQGLLAGAHRVEGTLFGHGERTGNVDLVTVAMNLEYQGIETGLDFSNLLDISRVVAEITALTPHPRHPYVGELVFTAFSGSHQDAIRKGLSRKDELAEFFNGWKIPYLHVEPGSIGRNFERFIRINSQSGKGGIAHVLEQDYHVTLPRWVQTSLMKYVQNYADEKARELTSDEVWEIFNQRYVQTLGTLELINYWPRPDENQPEIIHGEVHVRYRGEEQKLLAEGNGPISAFVHALRLLDGVPTFRLDQYAEGTRGQSADAEAACFVRLVSDQAEHMRIGIGFGSNIDQAAARAICAGLNAMLQDLEGTPC